MNFYYGLVDEETNAWGFVEETDPRVHEDMVYLTQEEWSNLLSQQSMGREIVGYDGQCFTAEPGRYYLDEQGWHQKPDEQFNQEKAQEQKEALVQEVYQMKADKAYGGVIINDTLIFETNQTAITNTVASLSLMDNESTAAWKFYDKEGAPVMQLVTKLQLATIAKFGQNMINQCFIVEGTFNEELKKATVAQLLDSEWVENFKSRAQAQMDAVNHDLVVQFAS